MENCFTTAGMKGGTTRTPAMSPVDRKPVKRNIGSYHQSHEPRVFCVIAPLHIAEAVARIVVRIRREENDRGCGSYLYVDPAGTAYLVREDQTASQRWIREHFDWLVGFYTKLPNPDRGLSIETHRMVEDIAEHLQQAGRATQGRNESLGLQQTGEANSLQPATAVAPLERPEGFGDIHAAGGGRSAGDGE